MTCTDPEERGPTAHAWKVQRPVYLDRWIMPIDLLQYHGEEAAREYARLRALELGAVAAGEVVTPAHSAAKKQSRGSA